MATFARPIEWDEARRASRLEHDLAPGVAPFELRVGLAHLGQGIDPGYRDLQGALEDHAGQLGEHVGARRVPVPLGLDPVLLHRREVDYRVDPIGPDA